MHRGQYRPPEGGHELQLLSTDTIVWRRNLGSLAGGMRVRGDNVSRVDTPNSDFEQSRTARAVQTRNKHTRAHPVCSPYLI